METPNNLTADARLHERILDRAVRHVGDHWLPVNPELLGRVRAGFDEGRYDLDAQFLIDDLKGDVALYTWSIRRVSEMLTQEFAGSGEQVSLKDIFRRAGNMRLKRLFSAEAAQISRHSLESSSDAQLAVLREAMISASTAEVLAENAGVDAGLGFTTAILRRLGLALVAWNYPSVYRRAVAQVSMQASLDDQLSQALGFSPLTLASALVARWTLLPANMRDAVTDESTTLEAADGAHKLATLCRVGEALARASDPERYPSAPFDWEFAKQTIIEVLGDDGYRSVQQAVRHNCISYQRSLPKTFENTRVLDPEQGIHEFQDEDLLGGNPHALQSSPGFRKELREWYAGMRLAQDKHAALRKLLKELAPLAGFTGGCVYTLEPGRNLLFPRVTLGKLVLRKPVSETLNSANNANLIYAAFYCRSLVHDQTEGDRNSDIGAIGASFGGDEAMGVLYLEYPQSGTEDMDRHVTVHYKALRQALHDCLGLT